MEDLFTNGESTTKCELWNKEHAMALYVLSTSSCKLVFSFRKSWHLIVKVIYKTTIPIRATIDNKYDTAVCYIRFLLRAEVKLYVIL